MKPKDGEPIFIDETMRFISRDLNKFENLKVCDGKFGQLVEIVYTCEKIIFELLKDAQVFWIDSITTDSLYNIPHKRNLRKENDYEIVSKLPFPIMFFEFEEPIEVKKVNGSDDMVKGMLYCKTKNLVNTGKFVNSDYEYYGKQRKEFSIFPFFVSRRPIYCELMFDINELPNFIFSAEEKIYEIDYERENYRVIDFFGIDREDEEIKEVNTLMNIINLGINLIHYINAENVAIERTERKNLDRINRKRIKKGKMPLPELKPYYWIKIKKSYVYEEREKGETWKLNWRVWVRGHMRHYKDGKGVWIEPYVKGPPNAPWRHQRYAVLYEKYGKRLG